MRTPGRARPGSAPVAGAALAVLVVVLVALAAVGGPAVQVTEGPGWELPSDADMPPVGPSPLPTPTGPPGGALDRGGDALGPGLALVLLLPLAALVVAGVAAAVLARRSRTRDEAERTAAEPAARPLAADPDDGTGAVSAPVAEVASAARGRHVVGGERASVVRLWTGLVAAAGGAPDDAGSPRAQERRLAARVGSPAARAAVTELRSLYEEAAYAATDPPPDRWERALRCADVLAGEAATAGAAREAGAGSL